MMSPKTLSNNFIPSSDSKQVYNLARFSYQILLELKRFCSWDISTTNKKGNPDKFLRHINLLIIS